MPPLRHGSVCLLVLLFTALPCGAEKGKPTDAADPLIPLERFGHFVARGRTPAEVERQLRPPDYRLSADLWVYWNCESNHPDDVARGYDTMIIGFADGRVNSVRLAPRAWVKALIAQLEAKRGISAGSSSTVAQR